jgi:predicted MFS family arabinose efflux permease
VTDAHGGLGLLVTIGLLLALHNANRFGITGIFGPLRERYGGAYAAVGNLFSAYPIAYACAQIPVGWLADRADPRRLILTGTATATVAGILFAMSESYAVAFAARLVAGACGALIYTPSMSFGINAFPRERRGTAIGVAYTGVGLGTAISIASLPRLVDAAGLTPALLALAGFGVVMMVVSPIGLALRRPPRKAPATSAASLLRQRPFQYLLGFSFLGFFNTYAILTWLPAYLTDVLGVEPAGAGALAALVNVSMTAASPFAGKLSDAFASRRRILEIGALASVVAFVALGATRSVALTVLAALLAGVSAAMTIAPMMVFATERFGEGAAGLAVGMVNGIGQTGSSLSGVVFGPVLDATGSFAAIWWTCLPLALVRYALLRAAGEAPASASDPGRS